MTLPPETTYFGHTLVPEDQKSSHVRGVFDSVATQYDLMNNVLSGGVHHLWKQRFVDIVAPHPGSLVLDVAGGTGDIALLLSKTKPGVAPPRIVCCDINLSMLREGQKRCSTVEGISLSTCDAESLPFPDATFDYYTIAFGIRNVTHIDKALQEAFRVLKPGGKFACLEFSHINNPLLAKMYTGYSQWFIPKLGKMIADDEASYRYLVESIERFPSLESFKGMIEQAGFSHVKGQALTFGVTAIHTGWRV